MGELGWWGFGTHVRPQGGGKVNHRHRGQHYVITEEEEDRPSKTVKQPEENENVSYSDVSSIVFTCYVKISTAGQFTHGQLTPSTIINNPKIN